MSYHIKKLNSYYIVIAILIVVPIALGILILHDFVLQKRTPTAPASKAQQLVEPKVTTWKVTTDVLNAPPTNASADQMRAYVALILSKAKETNIVRLKSCKPDPIVAKVPQSGVITIENMDGIDHTIVFAPGELSAIPKHSKAEVTIPFPKDIQILGYGCDGLQKGVGRFVSS